MVYYRCSHGGKYHLALDGVPAPPGAFYFAATSNHPPDDTHLLGLLGHGVTVGQQLHDSIDIDQLFAAAAHDRYRLGADQCSDIVQGDLGIRVDLLNLGQNFLSRSHSRHCNCGPSFAKRIS